MLAHPTDKLGFEIQTCSRCGGSGHYSYNQINGTTCFGCGGTGKKHTKRGAVAHAAYIESLKVRLGDLKVGDLLRVETFGRAYFAPIVEIGAPHVNGWSERDGVRKDSVVINVTTQHAKYGRSGLVASPDYMARKGWTAEEKAPLIAAALQLQGGV
jgi:hypothetical protein